jgi:hypothetical protein
MTQIDQEAQAFKSSTLYSPHSIQLIERMKRDK